MITTLTITGMSCVHCKRAVFTALAAVPGIVRADVSIGRAVIQHDGSVRGDALRDAVAAAGYKVSDVAEDRRTLPQAP
jgi:copper chaperone CopZ